MGRDRLLSRSSLHKGSALEVVSLYSSPGLYKSKIKPRPNNPWRRGLQKAFGNIIMSWEKATFRVTVDTLGSP